VRREPCKVLIFSGCNCVLAFARFSVIADLLWRGLAAIHSLALFIGQHSPEHVQWCGGIRLIPFKKASRPLVIYLEKAEMDALLSAPDTSRAQGRRDHALLLPLITWRPMG
jgi:site-specific recombinase XerD